MPLGSQEMEQVPDHPTQKLNSPRIHSLEGPIARCLCATGEAEVETPDVWVILTNIFSPFSSVHFSARETEGVMVGDQDVLSGRENFPNTLFLTEFHSTCHFMTPMALDALL